MNICAPDRTFWTSRRDRPEYRFLVEYLHEQYAALPEAAPLTFSAFMAFHRTGSRSEYERPYLDRRRRLGILAMLSLLYPENSRYLDELEDCIWAICDEYCWALPAHVRDFENSDQAVLDLMACETGYALSEIAWMLGDRLEPLIRSRIAYELKRRVIQPFEDKPWGWETSVGNWSAVCAAGVGVTLMLVQPDRFWECKPRLDDCMACFLQSYREDGVCREGLGYWHYGFGYFSYYADMLDRFSDGRFNYFDNSKVRTIAAFAQNSILMPGVAVSFADCDMSARYQLGLQCLLAARYPGNVTVPPLAYASMDMAYWPRIVSAFRYYNPAYIGGTLAEGDRYFPQSSWYIRRGRRYALAAKGGDNDEPHNHNDLGSFILAVDGRQVLCDLGAGEYTWEYFNGDRYAILCNGSLGHSVPIIAGKGQQAGRDHTAVMQVGDGVNIDMTLAYDCAGLRSLVRSLIPEDAGVVVRDCYQFSGGFIPYTERFVTLDEPVMGDGCIRLRGARLLYDSGAFTAGLSVEKHYLHMSDHQSVDVYCIDLTPAGGQCCCEVTLAV